LKIHFVASEGSIDPFQAQEEPPGDVANQEFIFIITLDSLNKDFYNDPPFNLKTAVKS
jgi:hypothetical protein